METDWIHMTSISIAGRINRYVQKEGLEFQKMILGMEMLMINIPKLVLITLIAICLGTAFQTFVTLFVFGFIRRYAGGLHAKKNITCTLASVFMFIAVPYVFQGAVVSGRLVSALLICTTAALYRFAPADTAARPILGKKKRDMLKRKAVMANMILWLAALIIHDGGINFFIGLGAIYSTIAILPCTYTILKRSVNNYERYE